VQAHLEPLEQAAVLRVFGDGKRFGKDAYEWAVTVSWIDDGTVELLAMGSPPSAAVRRAGFAALREVGVKAVTFRRLRGGRLVTRRIKVPGVTG
jgi:hypothetical protein